MYANPADRRLLHDVYCLSSVQQTVQDLCPSATRGTGAASRSGPPAAAGPEEPWFDVPAPDAVAKEGHAVAETSAAHAPETTQVWQDPLDYAADDLSVMLCNDDPPGLSLASRLVWSAGIVMLLLAAGLQVLWFNRDQIYSHYPQLVPIVAQICENSGCRVFRERSSVHMVLLNRDVREHPRFLNALLINATIENRSAQTRPYPHIQLILYDTNGVVSGYRQFSPAEYLPENVPVEQGMKPAAPVHIVLEVSGADENAVSFEFRFVNQ